MLGSIAGNYASVMIFAVFLAVLKLGGEIVGWGMHFQNLNFLKLSVVALFLFTLYTFEIITLTPSLKIKNETQKVFWENFISSIIASITAIPCTAPFLGTAAAFAIQGTMTEIFIIFLAIATGFSMPYIFSLFIPAINRIPRIISTNWGKFSIIAKKIINLGILGTFLWMLFLLSNHINTYFLGIYLFSFFLCAFLFKKNYNVAAIILLLGVLVIPDEQQFVFQNTNDGIWKKYQNTSNVSDILNEELISKRIVIFNISADWCLTCKYNKINVLNNKNVINLIKAKNIVCIEGDLTRKNDVLMAFIHKYNRAGIPFTIIYGPNARNGIILSEILSIDEITKAIKKAEK
jgi:suppressor for copper-sensitivity B